MTFKLDRAGDGKHIVILSLYVDDGLAATNNDVLYEQFLADLRGRFELSECGDLKWYLRIAISQNLVDGTTTISQEQYVKQLLNRFNINDCNPKTTLMSPNSRLLKSDCPAPGKGDKKLSVISRISAAGGSSPLPLIMDEA